MGGRYPTYYRRAGRTALGFQGSRSYSDPTGTPVSNPGTAARRAANEARMLELANRVGELDRRAGPIKQPNPLQNLPAWAARDAANRAAHNPVWAKALARAQRNALRMGFRVAMQISPLGRILNVWDLAHWGFSLTQIVPGSSTPTIPANWVEVSRCNDRPETMSYGSQGTNCWVGVVVQENFDTTWRTQISTWEKISQYSPGFATATKVAEYAWNGVEPFHQWSLGQAAPAVWADVATTPDFANAPAVATSTDPFVRPGSGTTPFVPRTKPEKGVMERKALTHGRFHRAIKRLVNGVTETMDVFNCAYESLPDDIKGYKKLPPVRVEISPGVFKEIPRITFGGEQAVKKPFRRQHTKAKILYENYDKMDLGAFAKCLATNHLEDWAIGTLASKAGPFGGKYGRPIGFTSGPAL
jgi:hypothetical protein